MILRSALYVGAVLHRRLRPVMHHLRYRVFWILFDLDEIEQLPRRLWLFSRNRFNALSFYDTDHGDGGLRPLREQIDGLLRSADIDLPGGAIRLLCMPRIFGYGFNPLSIFFCYAAGGSLAAMIYEVHNTFGQRHSYLFPVSERGGEVIEHRCDKEFYVSPFMDMDMTYDFRVALPDRHVSVAIATSDRAGVQLVAALTGDRRMLSDAALLRVLITHPLLTLKVIGAIHWHAARMLLKGLRLRPRPEQPPAPVTIVCVKG
jgi:uncharacterized protein